MTDLLLLGGSGLERGALESGLEAVVLRFGLFWGPGTWYESEPDDERPHVHVDEAGRRAAEMLFQAPPGVHEIGRFRNAAAEDADSN